MLKMLRYVNLTTDANASRSMHILTVLFLTGFTAWTLGVVYLCLVRKAGVIKSAAHLSWLAYQIFLGASFFLLALGAEGDQPDFYIISLIFILSASFSRFLALSTNAGQIFSKKLLGVGVGVILGISLLYEFCQYLGAPLVSLQVIVLLPISVASGLTAKYLFDAGMVRATMLKAMAHIFALESFIFGAIVLVVLAGVGQVFVNLDSKVVALGLLFIFVAELLLYVLWLIHVTLDEKSFASFNPANMSLKAVSTKPKKAMQTDGHTSAKKIAKNLNESNEVVGEAKLTAKELDVLSQLVAGKKNKEIADKFGISKSVICDIKHKRRWSHISL